MDLMRKVSLTGVLVTALVGVILIAGCTRYHNTKYSANADGRDWPRHGPASHR